MKILATRINNILSIENESIDFEDNGLVLVEGWNYDDNRATGAGKTAIFNAICFGLYEKIPKKGVTVTQLLREGTKKGFVEVDIQAQTRKITVRRERPNKLLFFENGQQIDMTQEGFEKIIKLTYEQFVVAMYTAQRASNKFIDKNDTEKKDFLLALKNMSEFNICRKEADRESKAINEAISAALIKKSALEAKIDVYKDGIADPKELNQRILLLKDTEKKHQLYMEEWQQIKQPDPSKYAKMDQLIQDQTSKFASERAKRTLLYDQYRKLSLQDKPFAAREPDAECPHCAGELNIRGNSVVKADDTKALKKQHEEYLAEVRQQMAALKLQIDACDVVLKDEKKFIDLAKSIKEKKQSEYDTYQTALDKIAEFRNLMNNCKRERESVEVALANLGDTQSKIDTLTAAATQLENQIFEKRLELEILEAASSMFAPTGAPAYVMDGIVESFNEAVSKYVDMIWPNAVYKLTAYKEKKDGDITAKFSESLIVNGKEKSIGQLSGGEFRSMSLALDFAVVDILSKQFGMPLNPIVLDEPFDGLDAVGRNIVVELLEHLSADRQIWVIDHASEAKAMFSKIIRIEKRQDVSRIVPAT